MLKGYISYWRLVKGKRMGGGKMLLGRGGPECWSGVGGAKARAGERREARRVGAAGVLPVVSPGQVPAVLSSRRRRAGCRLAPPGSDSVSPQVGSLL